MKITITAAKNFIRIFQVPAKYPEGYCFDGGKPATFFLVDWFHPFEQNKFVDGKIIKMNAEEIENHHNLIRDFIRKKTYFNPAYTFLAITNYSDVFFI